MGNIETTSIKICSYCKEPKKLSEFRKDSKGTLGVDHYCIECRKRMWHKHYNKNKSSINLNAVKYRKTESGVASHRSSCKKYYTEHKEELLEKDRKYRRSKAGRIVSKRYANKKIKENGLYKLRINCRDRIRYAFRRINMNKTSKSLILLGADIQTIKMHLESQFKPGMSWDNRSEWHIDHVIPLASAKNKEELESLCHYKNLQPLWIIENKKKGCRIL